MTDLPEGYLPHDGGMKLLPCPFCGASPHIGLTKKKHCQLHGEEYQDTRIWCPHGCASVERAERFAIAAWNTRPAPADPVAQIVAGLRNTGATGALAVAYQTAADWIERGDWKGTDDAQG